MKKNVIFLALIIVMTFTLAGCDSNLNAALKNKKLSPEQARINTENYINENLMANGSKAKIEKVTEENGLYKLSVNIGEGQIIDSYVTKDGGIFFPQALEIKKTEEVSNNTDNSNIPLSDAPKSDKPVVELFVMSHCPYGTQIEKGILPVVEALGNNIAFELKFCDYAMHGEKELKEQLNQYCISTEQNDKLTSYLKCFLNSSDGESCLKEAKIDTKKLASCVTKTDKEYKVTENFKNQVGYQGSYPGFDIFKADNEKYNVGGSPTLIINGAEVQSNRDAQSLMNVICASFNDAPEACNKQVSSDTPAPGFGSATQAAASGDTGCGE